MIVTIFPLRRLLRSLPFIFFNCRLITMCKWDSLPPLNNHLVNFANNTFFSVCSCHLIACSSTESSPCRPILRGVLLEHLFTVWAICTFPHPHHLDSAGLCVDLKHKGLANWKTTLIVCSSRWGRSKLGCQIVELPGNDWLTTGRWQICKSQTTVTFKLDGFCWFTENV